MTRSADRAPGGKRCALLVIRDEHRSHTAVYLSLRSRPDSWVVATIVASTQTWSCCETTSGQQLAPSSPHFVNYRQDLGLRPVDGEMVLLKEGEQAGTANSKAFDGKTRRDIETRHHESSPMEIGVPDGSAGDD